MRSVTARYRPEGRRPVLPVLTTNSSLADFLTYALLNQPRVEAAYYDWAASVERITVDRSLPDPQITFQMDIQQVVTSLMPGLMMTFPGFGKLRAAGQLVPLAGGVVTDAGDGTVLLPADGPAAHAWVLEAG